MGPSELLLAWIVLSGVEGSWWSWWDRRNTWNWGDESEEGGGRVEAHEVELVTSSILRTSRCAKRRGGEPPEFFGMVILKDRVASFGVAPTSDPVSDSIWRDCAKQEEVRLGRHPAWRVRGHAEIFVSIDKL